MYTCMSMGNVTRNNDTSKVTVSKILSLRYMPYQLYFYGVQKSLPQKGHALGCLDDPSQQFPHSMSMGFPQLEDNGCLSDLADKKALLPNLVSALKRRRFL